MGTHFLLAGHLLVVRLIAAHALSIGEWKFSVKVG